MSEFRFLDPFEIANIVGNHATNQRKPSYSDNFKFTAVSMVIDQKQNAIDVAMQLKISISALNNWIKQYTNYGTFKTAKKITKQESELKELKKISNKLNFEFDLILQILAKKLSQEEKIELVDANKNKYPAMQLCKALNLSINIYNNTRR